MYKRSLKKIRSILLLSRFNCEKEEREKKTEKEKIDGIQSDTKITDVNERMVGDQDLGG